MVWLCVYLYVITLFWSLYIWYIHVPKKYTVEYIERAPRCTQRPESTSAYVRGAFKKLDMKVISCSFSFPSISLVGLVLLNRSPKACLDNHLDQFLFRRPLQTCTPFFHVRALLLALKYLLLNKICSISLVLSLLIVDFELSWKNCLMASWKAN